ncbi:hypothetical protein [Streptomyces sp. Act143]
MAGTRRFRSVLRPRALTVVHPGNPEPAADLAEFDARCTEDGDGVHDAGA